MIDKEKIKGNIPVNELQYSFRLLLVEDENKLAYSIRRQLSREQFEVDIAFDGLEAERKISSKEYHLIILDVNLPYKSGIDILIEMRERGDRTPVLILSAKDKVEDRVRGLKSGADDYLIKPFDSGELSARIKAILNRAGLMQATVLRAGDLFMDLVNRSVSRAGKEITLSPKEFALLEYLLKNKNQVITSKRIAQQVWNYTFDTGSNIVNVYVNYLRKAIDEGFEKKLIQTIRGEGFILVDE